MFPAMGKDGPGLMAAMRSNHGRRDARSRIQAAQVQSRLALENRAQEPVCPNVIINVMVVHRVDCEYIFHSSSFSSRWPALSCTAP